MQFKQQILIEHDGGVTAQWKSTGSEWMAIATYQMTTSEVKQADGTLAEYKRYALVNCSGPWTGFNDGELQLLPGYEEERDHVSGEAGIILTCLNAYMNGAETLNSFWTADRLDLKTKP